MSSLKDLNLEYINSKPTCYTCGAEVNIDFKNCPYCRRELTELSVPFAETEKILQQNLDKDIPFDVENCYELIKLYSIRDHVSSSLVKQFLEKQKVVYKINEFINKINNKIETNQKLDVKEDYIYFNLLVNNVLEYNQILVDKILRSIFLNKPLVSEEVFREIIKYFVKTNLIIYNQDRIPNYEPRCIIRGLNHEEDNDDKYTLGSVFSYTTVYLDEQVIKDIYNGNVSLFQTIFHEMYHIFDEIDKLTSMFSNDILNHIKESIIKELEERNVNGKIHKSNYYKNNYSLISFEKDAEINGYIYLFRYLGALSLDVSKDTFKEIDEKINHELSLKQEQLRNVDFSSSALLVDEVFEYYVKEHPEYLMKYPQLTVEYIEEDGMVRHKTKSEIIDTLLDTNNSLIKNYLKDWLRKNKEKDAKSRN